MPERACYEQCQSYEELGCVINDCYKDILINSSEYDCGGFNY
jgi:hypothetical protein